MTREFSHEEAVELLGAYAIHATESDEHAALAAHIEECPVCLGELAEHYEIVSVLVGDGEPVPEGLWDRIILQLEEEPPPLRAVAGPTFMRPSRGRMISALAAITTAAAVIAGLAGVGIISQTGKLNKLESSVNGGSIEQSALAAGNDPANRHIVLSSADGKYQLDSVLTTDGHGFITGGNLPAVDANRTYQLWAISAGKPISVGLIGRQAQAAAFQLPSNTTALALTNEASTGAIRATQPPIVVAAVNA